MARRLFGILALLSLALLVGVAVLWMRGLVRYSAVGITLGPKVWSLGSRSGRLTLWVLPAGPLATETHKPQVNVQVPGGGLSAHDQQLWATLPCWVAFLLTAAVPYLYWVGMMRKRRKRLRIARGRCPECDYDLRASTGRCPECGWEIAPMPSP